MAFPDVWKIAKVSPLFKEGSLLDRSNFRPISVLATVSKILERHVHSNFYGFLASYDLLTDFQFGFRWFCSCELAVMNLSDCILTNMDRGLLSGLLLIDLKKAFDLVNHSTCCLNSAYMVVLHPHLSGLTRILLAAPKKRHLKGLCPIHFLCLSESLRGAYLDLYSFLYS